MSHGMHEPPLEFLVTGGAQRPAPPVQLCAGPCSASFADGSLRYVRLGSREVLRGVYAAVRDAEWNTIPPVLRDITIASGPDAFVIEFTAEHRSEAIHFVWRTRIQGDRDGTIEFRVAGEARSAFLSNRVGLCVLHPIEGCAGRPCRVERVDGTTAELWFPERVAAEQPVAGFHGIRALAHEVGPGLWAEVTFHGEVFETEDQRNWIDASFKTYGTPLGLPRPVAIPAGATFHQSVRLRLRAREGSIPEMPSLPRPTEEDDGVVEVEWSPETLPLPAIGLQQRNDPGGAAGADLPVPAQNLLRDLDLAHLRVELRLSRPDWRGDLARGWRTAQALDCPVELALLVARDRLTEVPALVRELTATGSRLRRLLVLEAGARSTSCALFMAVRDHLATLRVPVGLGTEGDLYDLDLAAAGEAAEAGAEFIAWSMNPQVHAFDNLSLAETPAGAAEQVRALRHWFPRTPLVVTPVTLRPRRSTAAALAGDPRQGSLFGAGWTLAMLNELAAAGAESVSLYETTGPRGIMMDDAGGPGRVFPVHHVLRALAGFRLVLRTHSSAPRKVAALTVLDADSAARLLVANLQAVPQAVRLPAACAAGRFGILDETTVRSALREPEHWRAGDRKRPAPGPDGRTLVLPPCALLLVDVPALPPTP